MQNKHACRKKTELVKAGDAPAPLQRPRCRAARAQRVTCALAPASRRLRQRSAPQIVQQPMGARHQARVPHCQGMHPDLKRCCRRGAGAAPGENWGEVSSLSGRTWRPPCLVLSLSLRLEPRGSFMEPRAASEQSNVSSALFDAPSFEMCACFVRTSARKGGRLLLALQFQGPSRSGPDR